MDSAQSRCLDVYSLDPSRAALGSTPSQIPIFLCDDKEGAKLFHGPACFLLLIGLSFP